MPGEDGQRRRAPFRRQRHDPAMEEVAHDPVAHRPVVRPAVDVVGTHVAGARRGVAALDAEAHGRSEILLIGVDELLDGLFTLAIRDQQQDVNAIPDDARVSHRHQSRGERDRVLKDVVDGRIQRVLELRVVAGARDGDRRGDLHDVRRRRRRPCREAEGDQHRQQALHRQPPVHDRSRIDVAMTRSPSYGMVPMTVTESPVVSRMYSSWLACERSILTGATPLAYGATTIVCPATHSTRPAMTTPVCAVPTSTRSANTQAAATTAAASALPNARRLMIEVGPGHDRPARAPAEP